MKGLQQDVVWIYSMAVMAAYVPTELITEFSAVLDTIKWYRRRTFALCILIILRLREHKDCGEALKRFVAKSRRDGE